MVCFHYFFTPIELSSRFWFGFKTGLGIFHGLCNILVIDFITFVSPSFFNSITSSWNPAKSTVVINVECIGKTFMFRSGEKVERNLKNLTTERLAKGGNKIFNWQGKILKEGSICNNHLKRKPNQICDVILFAFLYKNMQNLFAIHAGRTVSGQSDPGRKKN